MMDMMETSGNWMMGLGWIGMLLGAAVAVLLIVLLVVLIQRVSSRSPHK